MQNSLKHGDKKCSSDITSDLFLTSLCQVQLCLVVEPFPEDCKSGDMEAIFCLGMLWYLHEDFEQFDFALQLESGLRHCWTENSEREIKNLFEQHPPSKQIKANGIQIYSS